LPSKHSKGGHNLGSRKKIWVPHPCMEGEDLAVIMAEGGGIHVIENNDITKNLPDPFSGPSMRCEMLDIDFDMVEPIRGAGV
jgi:hypothetical protein